MSLFTLQNHPLNGPVINAGIVPSKQRQAALKEAGKPVPQPQVVRALIDTGASCSCVDPRHLTALGLSPTGTVQIHTPSNDDEPTEHDQYDVGVVIVAGQGDHPLYLDTVPIVASSLEKQGIDALIGRDILAGCVLVYNGKAGLFTLAF